jgi:hypothetical protein
MQAAWQAAADAARHIDELTPPAVQKLRADGGVRVDAER